MTEPERTAVDGALRALSHLPGALLPVLHAVHDALGYVPADAVPAIAKGLNVSSADVHGVLTFYHDFRTAPVGRHHLRICRAEACQAVGGEALVDHLRTRHGCSPGETRSDGVFGVDDVYCLGNCALGPAAMVDRDGLLARVTTDRLDALVASWEREA